MADRESVSLVSCYNAELILYIGSDSALVLEHEAAPSHMFTCNLKMAQVLTLQVHAILRLLS